MFCLARAKNLLTYKEDMQRSKHPRMMSEALWSNAWTKHEPLILRGLEVWMKYCLVREWVEKTNSWWKCKIESIWIYLRGTSIHSQWIQAAGSAGLQPFHPQWWRYAWCLFSCLNKDNSCDKSSQVELHSWTRVRKSDSGGTEIWNTRRTSQL